MRRVALYLFAAGLLAVAMGVVAPLLGLPVGARATSDRGPVQSVNRARKGDRLILPTAGDKLQRTHQLPTIIVGCEPAFSPLAASARANFSSRCIV